MICNEKPEVGWDYKPVRSQKEVADMLGISRGRVQAIEREAMQKLKHLLKEKYDRDK